MKILIVLFILIYAFFPKSFANTSEEVRRAEAFQACVNDCLTFEEPGYALRACLESCKDKYNLDMIIEQPLYCNTDEEDCERDDESEI